MPDLSQFLHVSAAPTNHPPAAGPKAFDVADLYATGPMADVARPPDGGVPLDEELRPAYSWIVNRAIISPHCDLEYFVGPHPSYTFGDSKMVVNLPFGQSYSGFVPLPLLNFAVRRRWHAGGWPGPRQDRHFQLDGRIGWLVAHRGASRHTERATTDDDLRPARQPTAR